MTSPADGGALSEAQRQALAAGDHEAVAAQLLEAGHPGDAAWVLEQIWAFDAAFSAYAQAERWVDALRMALESDRGDDLDTAIARIVVADRSVQDDAVALLKQRGRHMAVERVLAARKADPLARAQSLLLAGDTAGAARLLAESGRAREALDLIVVAGSEPSGDALGLAARLCWDLGDAEGAARYAQADLRQPSGGRLESAALLARALGSLGHDLAAQMVLDRSGAQARDESLPGRYRVTGLHAAGLTGAAYVGFDRVTLQEVEIHLLLAEQPHAEAPDPMVTAAIRRFAAASRAAAAIGHPSIRPVLRVEEDAGLVVLPRAEGPTLRSMIRPPGMLAGPSRARALVAFLLEGLVAAHGRGLVHGWLLPSAIVTDAVGRPLLGPFGANHLAGLAATHTGSLEEILRLTAPELRGREAPTVASDLYAVGVLLGALLQGSLTEALREDGTPELALARRLTDADPSRRPSGAATLAELRRTVADVRDLERAARGLSAPSKAAEVGGARLADGIAVEAAVSWEDEVLDALCEAGNPWWQPIVDRAERTVVVAPWPEGSRSLDTDTPEVDWRRVIPAGALDVADEALRDALAKRLRATSLVATPSGSWMLALDDLLSR